MEITMKKIQLSLIAILMSMSQFVWAQITEVKLHYVGATEGSAWLGVQQGLAEANIQGEFLGQKYTLETVSATDLQKLDAVMAILVAGDAKQVLTIAKQFNHVPVFNLASDSDDLRSACLDNVLNVGVSQRMKQDAQAQMNNKRSVSKAIAQGWHKDFRKFSASQLNGRFTKAQGQAMTDNAWAGWAAVKMLSDTVARSQITQAEEMLRYLKNDLAFDGQKGAGATFRDTGQLRQLVLLIENNKIVAEAPLRGVKGGLDSLGLVSCK